LRAEDAIDWEKARGLHQRATSGETLTGEEKAYYDRARKAVSEGKAPFQKGNNGQTPGGNAGSASVQSHDGQIAPPV